MDISHYLRVFESSLSSYSGDDPLDAWDKFVDYLEKGLPADALSGMSQVLDTLVERFLHVERYANDIRYVNYCIRCASYYPDPVAMYNHIYSKGVGTRTAALYVAWAQQFEQRGVHEQAEAVYFIAMQNQAQPADLVLSEHRQFQARTRSQTSVTAGSRNPLQNSHLTNQMTTHREPVTQNKVSVECPSSKPAPTQTTITVSRSHTSGTLSSAQGGGVQTVAAYAVEALACEGSELCFEEVRAQRYFQQLQERREREKMESVEKELQENQDNQDNEENQDNQEKQVTTMSLKTQQDLQALGGFIISPPPPHTSVPEPASTLNPHPTHNAFGRPPPVNRLSQRRSLGLRLHNEPVFLQEGGPVAAAGPGPGPGPGPVGCNGSLLPSAPSDRSSMSPDPAAAPSPGLTDPAPVDQTPVVQQSRPEDSRPPMDPTHPTHTSTLQQDDELQSVEPEDKLDMSQGAHTATLTHVTPNTSLGFVQATPSRVLPSPTVNTREALDVIMDMFQAPTLLEDPFSTTTEVQGPEQEEGLDHRNQRNQRNQGGVSFSKPAAAAPFTIFEDNDKENNSSAAVEKKPARALAEVQTSSRPNETPPPELAPDESTMWGAQFNSLHSLAACPNSTSDFAMLAQCVSTPFTHKTPVGGSFFQDQENITDAGDGDDEAFIRRQTKKLSPILESPSNETEVSRLAPPPQAQGTIMADGLCLTSSSITMVQAPPPAALSFRDHTLCLPRTTTPGWEVYTSPQRPPNRTSMVPPPQTRTEAFSIMEDVDPPRSPRRGQTQDVPMSPDCPLKPDWMSVRSPDPSAEPDLDAFVSPHRPGRREAAPLSPHPPTDQVMMSPDRGEKPGADVSMNASPCRTGPVLQLLSDPWGEDRVSALLAGLDPPLSAHPGFITWNCELPNICPKMTLSMGKASLTVDCVLGEGAFATVYQATDPHTSQKMVLKVQKPANPWEFYINTQLDSRLRPQTRHLFSRIHSAHLFSTGSVMLAELHNYGTLLNAVNLYRCHSERVMPQPLVLFLTVCILNMVEQLHRVHIVHADIKPDNFLLGERFLENRCFDPDNLDHGLVLIDLGQSIDMDLFPECTAFTSRCMTSGFQCTEMLSGKPWNYQTDLFGIAGTVHCMLFGTYMQVRQENGVWTTNGVFRRNPHADLWQEFFHVLLNVPDCSSLPDLRNMRLKLSSVLQENYSSKLQTLKSRMVVQLLESHRARR